MTGQDELTIVTSLSKAFEIKRDSLIWPQEVYKILNTMSLSFILNLAFRT